MSKHPIPAPATSMSGARLMLNNRGQDLVRARLLCAGVQAWDVWLGPGGRVTAPSFPPATGVLHAQLHNRRDQVCHEVRSPEWPLQGRAELLWSQVAGLPCLVWTRRVDLCRPELQVRNPHSEALQLALHFSASPYRLRLGLAPGGCWCLDPTQLSLLVVAQGVSAQCSLSQGHGDWTVQGGPSGLRLLPGAGSARSDPFAP